jgi:hypothetical protein
MRKTDNTAQITTSSLLVVVLRVVLVLVPGFIKPSG